VKLNHKEGILRLSQKPYGFVDDIYIPLKAIGNAMDGDRVEVLITNFKNQAFKGAGPEGRVIRILEAAEPLLVGTAVFTGGQFIAVPDDSRYNFPVILETVPEELLPEDKVVVRLVRRPGKYNAAEGKLEEILGGGNKPGVDITAIVAGMEIPREFPEEVRKQAEDCPAVLSEAEISEELSRGRRDLRQLSVVTIDSEDTKDVDDGISIAKKEDGHYLLGVHIADVTHYVGEGSPLDREAYERGTSVYLPDRVIPMLPRKLSNGICSLNCGTDRFAFTVMMELDENGRQVDADIFTSVINVKYKITYNQIYSLYEEQNQELAEQYREHRAELDMMKELAAVLHQRRHERGSIDFYFPETKVILDSEGKPLEVKPYPITFANNIIEEFMLLCNETVAERFYWMNIPFMYRVHREPDPERIQQLADTVRHMGYTLKGGSQPHPRAIQHLIQQVTETPRERVISTMALRALSKAEYSGSNDGHYALALDNYCHFTSPIRRYPDLLIHRIMKEALSGKMSPERMDYLRNSMSDWAEHCSETERRADEAEWASIDLKVAEYMEQFIGERFEGVISGVTSFGFFVELPNTVEGLVKYESLPEYYEFDRDRMAATGRRSGHTFEIGDPVSVVVHSVDMQLHKVEFVTDMGSGRRRAVSVRKEKKPRRSSVKRRRR
jgi:ribonuclease R